LLLVADLEQPQRDLLHVDLKARGIDRWDQLSAQSLGQHFEWRPGPDGAQRLQARPARAPAAWRTRYDYGMAAPRGPQGPMPRYTLWPVRPAMLAAARAAVVDELKAEPAPARAGDPPPERYKRLSMSVYPVVMRYDAAQQALVVETPELPNLTGQSAVDFIGELIDGRLAGGAWQAHLAPAGAGPTH
jgi:hypothetical protein